MAKNFSQVVELKLKDGSTWTIGVFVDFNSRYESEIIVDFHNSCELFAGYSSQVKYPTSIKQQFKFFGLLKAEIENSLFLQSYEYFGLDEWGCNGFELDLKLLRECWIMANV